MPIFTFILAGGSGTRLAPLSLTTPGKLPKQFLSLVGDKTMLQEAADKIPAGNKVIVIPEEKYSQTVAKQLGNNAQILAEPFGCNTAPAIGLAALYALKETNDPETVLFFMPADHIMDKTAFQKYFKIATETATQTDKIITIGIKPTRPETGYGYIKVAEKHNEKAYRVNSFVEKPNLETAKKYIATGGYYWNAGIFSMKIKTILAALQKDAPFIYEQLTAQPALLKKEGEQVVLANNGAELIKAYKKIKEAKQNISIDYAVMEKEAGNLLLIEAGEDLEWNDVGGWVALAKYIKPDNQNNLILNYLSLEIKLENCHDLLVVTSNNGILITLQASAQKAKEIILGIEVGKKTELISCQNTVLKNKLNSLYLGAIDLINYNIKLEKNTLTIEGN